MRMCEGNSSHQGRRLVVLHMRLADTGPCINVAGGSAGEAGCSSGCPPPGAFCAAPPSQADSCLRHEHSGTHSPELLLSVLMSAVWAGQQGDEQGGGPV